MGTTLYWAQTIGWDGMFAIQAAMGIGGAIFVNLMVPETKGKSLEMIEKQLRIGSVETPPSTPQSS